MCEWILTDDATEQHVKVISEKLGKYGVIDTIPYSRQQFAVVCGTVTVTESDLHNPAFVTAYLHPYGYESAQEMHQYYGADACQIAAECVFETSPLSNGDVLFEGTKEACFEYIDKYVGGIT